MHTQNFMTDSCSTHSKPQPPTFDSPLPLATLDNIALYSYNSENIHNSKYSYHYTQDLLTLHSHTDSTLPPLPLTALAITTPMVHHQWERALASHPDRQFVQHLTGNLQSALLHPAHVQEYQSTELQAGCIVGPVSHPNQQIRRNS